MGAKAVCEFAKRNKAVKDSTSGKTEGRMDGREGRRVCCMHNHGASAEDCCWGPRLRERERSGRARNTAVGLETPRERKGSKYGAGGHMRGREGTLHDTWGLLRGRAGWRLLLQKRLLLQLLLLQQRLQPLHGGALMLRAVARVDVGQRLAQRVLKLRCALLGRLPTAALRRSAAHSTTSHPRAGEHTVPNDSTGSRAGLRRRQEEQCTVAGPRHSYAGVGTRRPPAEPARYHNGSCNATPV